MKTKQPRMNKREVEAIERTAWYARLAFGCHQGKQSPLDVPEKSESTFYVMP